MTAAVVAILPLLLIIDDPAAAFGSTAGVYSVLETGLLLCLAFGGLVLSRLAGPQRREPGTSDSAQETAAR